MRRRRWRSARPCLGFRDVDPIDAIRIPDRWRAQVRVRLPDDARRLQSPAFLVAPRGAAPVFRSEPVKTGMTRIVLREIRHHRLRIDRDRLVLHATHGDDGLAGRRRRVRAHLEHVSVLASALRSQVNDGFLATEPRAPGRRTARAVVDRSAERRNRTDPFPAAKPQRRRAARRREAMLQGCRSVVTRRRQDRTRDCALVVAHQRDFERVAAPCLRRSRPSRRAGRASAGRSSSHRPTRKKCGTGNLQAGGSAAARSRDRGLHAADRRDLRRCEPPARRLRPGANASRR